MLDDRRLARFRNREVGFVFQAFNLLDHLTARENVKLPAYFGRVPTRERRRSAPSRRSRASASATRPSRARARSRAGRSSASPSRALSITGRKLLLCDEPTGNLDSETGAQIIELFRALNKEGLTLVIVTHEERVSSVASRVLRLEDGSGVKRQ